MIGSDSLPALPRSSSSSALNSFSPVPAPDWRERDARVLGADAGDGALERRDVVGGVGGVAAQPGDDERGTPVVGGQLGRAVGPWASATSGSAASRSATAAAAARGVGGVAGADQHPLGGGVLQAGGLDERVGAGRLARPALGEADRLGAGHGADRRAGHDEQQPQGDGGLGAPCGGADDALESHARNGRRARARAIIEARGRLRGPRAPGRGVGLAGPGGRLDGGAREHHRRALRR